MTLENPNPLVELLQGKEFPCPLCGAALDIRFSKTQKPYCICEGCGNQLFFRGKRAIERLREIVESGIFVSSKKAGYSFAVSLYNRLAQLKSQKDDLEAKQGLIFRDQDLDHTISVVDAEIEHLQAKLGKLAKKVKPEEK